VPTLLAAHTVPPEFAGRRAEYVRWIAEELIPEVATVGLAQFLRRILRRPCFHSRRDTYCAHSCTAAWAGLRVHAEQFRPVQARHCRRTGSGDGGPPGMATEDSLRELRTAGVQPCCCRGQYRTGRTNYPPARLMAELGLAIVVPQTSTPALRRLRRCVCDVARLPSDGPVAAESLTAATINAA